MPEINLDKKSQRWKYRCPQGHTQWRAINGRFYCSRCAKIDRPEAIPHFDELHDASSNSTYTREEVVFVSDSPRHYMAEYAVEQDEKSA